ncbi:hypothetical protein EJ06DRAFT_49648 [Trichodelitschia bisporula]|uniref:Uncharacterized protein n=1 Tax=Trichodelitschia bisporula TaxID=703511 RepID=A0A6G1HTZ5_9PEZI|nr:hypothetical protein EJ06DRAFT_49648 [Trichodelitschia bisporula]
MINKCCAACRWSLAAPFAMLCLVLLDNPLGVLIQRASSKASQMAPPGTYRKVTQIVDHIFHSTQRIQTVAERLQTDELSAMSVYRLIINGGVQWNSTVTEDVGLPSAFAAV